MGTTGICMLGVVCSLLFTPNRSYGQSEPAKPSNVIRLLKQAREISKEQPSEAIATSEVALSEAKALGDPYLIAISYNSIADYVSYEGRLPESIAYLDSAAVFALEAKDTVVLQRVINDAGMKYLRMGQINEARCYLEKCVELNTAINRPDLLAASYCNLAITYQKRGALSRAREFFEEALAIAPPGWMYISFVYNNLQNIHMTLGQLDSALLYGRQAMEATQERGDKDRYVGALVVQGHIYHLIGDHSVALKTGKEALYRIQQRGEGQDFLKNTHSLLSRAYSGLPEKRDSAILHSHIALKLCPPMDTLFMVKEYLALSDYFSAAGRLDSSYYYLDIGEHIAVRAELASERIDAEEIRASNLIQEGHFREAIAHARKALKMSERENQSLKKTELYKILQTAFDSIGDSQQAYHYFRKYAALKDSVYTSRTYFTAQELTDYQKLKATEEAFTVKVAALNQSKQKTVLLSSVAIIAALMLLFFTWRYFKKKEGHTMRFLISKLNKLGKPGQASERLEELLPAGISEMKELSGELQRLQDMINEEGGAAKATAHQEDIDTMVKEKIEYLEGLQFSISHDLKRYVLNLQNQLSQLVSRNQPLSPSEVAPVQKITEEMILFMEQLKEIHRIDELSIQASYINLQDLVKDVLQQLSPEQNYPGVQIDLRGELPTVETDPLLARQVITNLLENALKYSQNSAQPRVEIGLTNKGRETALYVRDNGEGIPDDDQSRIFEPFYRSSHTKVEGTGLGLAISRIAAQKLGGGLRVESRLGQGSTFIFALSA